MGWRDTVETVDESAPIKKKSWRDTVETIEEPKKEKSLISLRGLGKGAIEALPVAGGLLGGTVGSIGGPVGAVAGWGGGAMAGETLRQTLNKAFYPEDAPKDRLEQYGQLAVQGLSGAGGEAGGQVLGKVVSSGASLLGKKGKEGLIKVGETLSGVPKKEIETYSSRPQAVKQIIDEYHGNIAAASDDAREGLLQSIRSKRAGISNKIGETLKESDPFKVKSINPIIEELESAKSKLSPNYHAKDIQEIDEMILNIKNEAKKLSEAKFGSARGSGLSAMELNDTKQYLQDIATPSYQKGMQIFQKGDKATQAAKKAASRARLLVDEIEPRVTGFNEQLSKIHKVEDNINKSLLNPNKPESSFLAAGSGTNQRGVNALKELDELAGTNTLETAQNLAAARRFGNAGLTSVEPTGKDISRQFHGAKLGGLLGGGIGLAVGHPVTGAAIGAGAGSLMTSPAAIKAAIDTGRIGSDIVKSLGGESGAMKFFMTRSGQAFLQNELSKRALPKE